MNARLFLEHLDVLFKREPGKTDAGKVQYGASLLAGRAEQVWHSRQRDQYSYRDFENFVLSTIPDRNKPSIEVVMAYFEIKQKDGQSIQEFVVEMEDLEAQMPHFSEPQRVLHLLAKLHEPLRVAITDAHGVPRTRAELIMLAQMTGK